ncbi:Galectin-9, partial [Pseudolycoriella hygida]
MCLKRCFEKILLCKKYNNDADEVEHLFASGEMIDAQSNHEIGLIYSCSNLKDVVPGASYYITGNILHNCERFAVNFSYDSSGRDIALHVNPRLPQNYIVRNCKINGQWGTEECLQVKGDVSDVSVEYGNVLEYPDRFSGNGSRT